jgi:ABC-type branched-subunit amino acid transport system substrate-binding protein
MRGLRLALLGLLVVASLGLAACGDDDNDGGSSGGTTAPGATAAESTELGPGVTATEIKIGIPLSDFKAIAQFVDMTRVDQEANYNAFIKDINDRGGINGRKIVPVFYTFNPIPDAQRLASVCTRFTEDEKVFAVLGNVFDPSGNSQTCVAKRHNTPLFAYMLTQEIIEKSPGGLIVYPGTAPERIVKVMTGLLKDAGTLNGKKVGILGETSSSNTVKNAVQPALKELGVEAGSAAILQISGPDTATAQSQLDGFVERWKTEGVGALWVTGTQVADNQFVEKVKAALPDVLLVTDVATVIDFGRDEQKSGVSPNPYDGILTATGPNADEYDNGPNWKHCADIWGKATGKVAPKTNDVLPDIDGKRDDLHNAINDACQMLGLFEQIATKVGPNLNAENWKRTVNSYGPITDYGGGEFASLTEGKYDIQDTFRLSEFDPSIKPNGDWKALTDLQNIPGS